MVYPLDEPTPFNFGPMADSEFRTDPEMIMSDSIWQRSDCGSGRSYMLGTEPYVKYDDQEAIISTVKESLKKFVNIKTAVRLTLDTELSNAERTIIAIPFESNDEQIVDNFARLITQSLMAYYISADPKTSHFGISNLLLEGKINSLLKREMEKLLQQFQERPDLAGRLLSNVELAGKVPVPEPGDIFLSETIRKGLDIHLGYRIFVTGVDVNYTKIFVPITAGKEVIDYLYYNLEQILHHNFISYDETGDRYLAITEPLVFKELEAVLKRAKTKEMTRNKILNNLQFNTIEKSKIVPELEMLAGDSLYDFLNHIQDTKLQKATERSRELYLSYLQEAVHSLAKEMTVKKEAAEEKTVEQVVQKPVRRTRSGSTSQSSAAAPNHPPASSRGRVPGVRQQGGVQVPQPPRENLRVPSRGQGEGVPSPDKVKA